MGSGAWGWLLAAEREEKQEAELDLNVSRAGGADLSIRGLQGGQHWERGEPEEGTEEDIGC